MNIVETLLNYASQASTWNGLFTILGTYAVALSDGLMQAIIAVCVAVFGLVYVIIDERAKRG